jgi:hypothetical protein
MKYNPSSTPARKSSSVQKPVSWGEIPPPTARA